MNSLYFNSNIFSNIIKEWKTKSHNVNSLVIKLKIFHYKITLQILTKYLIIKSSKIKVIYYNHKSLIM